ncbi:MAG: alpha/beta hydrolase [Alphaproteobacteria bacterium]|nr:MAG: alpha/beta hydrolase [Alphaproteobacteria bacterium]
MRAAVSQSEGTIDRDGVELHYEVYGEGEHTILFIPPWSIVHSRIYKGQIPYFSDHFRVVTFDPRGNGKSGRPSTASDYNIDFMVEDALVILDETKTEKAIVFGLSLGGLYSALLASYFPERVEALIACGTVMPLVPAHAHKDRASYEAKRDDYQGWQKFNEQYWLDHYEDFCAFFMSRLFCEAHSTKQIEDGIAWSSSGDGEMLAMTYAAGSPVKYRIDESVYRRITCPSLWIHGLADEVTPPSMSEKGAELTKGELHLWPRVGHAPNARFPARVNMLVRDFLARKLGIHEPVRGRGTATAPSRKTHNRDKKILYLSSPIGLGHARRDLAISHELRKLHSGLRVDWLAQDPVTRFLDMNNERIHPGSCRLANESAHIEAESGEHDLNAFQAIRNMDEILIKNFMIFQEVLEQDKYDLVIADEAWDVDHYWHEHPDLKRTQIAWLTDFVGWVPMPGNGAYEAFLTEDYNAEMIGHVENNPRLRDRSIFVGNPADIIPHSFGKNLPRMRDWIPRHFDFCGYVLGRHPQEFGARDELRNRLGYRSDEKICIVTVGGSGVGANLIRRTIQAYPIVKWHLPELRMIVVTGPRLDPNRFDAPEGVELRSFVPDLDRHLAACDLALVQGGLTTAMELTAAGVPFLYFPLKNHFEQNFHVAHRLDQYNAGRRMQYDESSPEHIAEAMREELLSSKQFKPVEPDGAARAARMLSELL